MDKVQHFEIPMDDMARGRKFYEEAFGWKTSEWPLPDGDVYVGAHTGPVDEQNMWKESGFINGGLIKRGGQAFPITSPVITVVTDDIDAALERVKAAGGVIVKDKEEIPQTGIYAYIKDTEGNIIGVWQEIKKS